MSDTLLEELATAQEATNRGWDDLVGGNDLFLSTRWLRVAEATAGVPMRYLLASASGRLTGALATALADDVAPWVLGRPDTLLQQAVDDGLRGAAELRAGLPSGDAAALLPSLVCGGRHMGRTRVLVRDGDRHTLGLLVDRAEQTARELGARSLCFPFVDERDVELRAALADRGYASHASGRYSWLRLPAGGLDGWLELLSSKRRRRVITDRHRVEEAGYRFELVPLREADVPRLAELETQLLHKYGIAWTPSSSEATLRSVRATFGDDAVTSLAVHDGIVRGFGLLLRHQDQWYARSTGFDYAFQKSLPLYFEVLYSRLAESAPAAGVTGVHYGLGSEAAKRSRGCDAVDQDSYVRLVELA